MKNGYIQVQKISTPGCYEIAERQNSDNFVETLLWEDPMLNMISFFRKDFEGLMVRRFFPKKRTFFGLFEHDAHLKQIEEGKTSMDDLAAGIYLFWNGQNSHFTQIFDYYDLNSELNGFNLKDIGNLVLTNNKLQTGISETDGMLSVLKSRKKSQEKGYERISATINFSGSRPGETIYSAVRYLNHEIERSNLPVWKKNLK